MFSEQNFSLNFEIISSLTKQAAKILSGCIFYLLILNVAFIATSLFQIEVVSLLFEAFYFDLIK